MLKQWMCNPDLGEITIEQKYRSWVENLRTDKYVTVEPWALHAIKWNDFVSCEYCLSCVDSELPNPSHMLQWPYQLPPQHVIWEYLSQVTIFQLEKLFGKGKEAQEFIAELCKGDLAYVSLRYFEASFAR